jgi:hypothetical protein
MPELQAPAIKTLYIAPVITSCSSLDNVDNDVELITISSSASSTVYRFICEIYS